MRPESLFVARRLADYTLLAHDPMVAQTSATFWEQSQAAYRRVETEVAGFVAGDRLADEARRNLIHTPRSVPAYRTAVGHISRLLDADEVGRHRLAALVQDSSRAIWIDHHLGEHHRAVDRDPWRYTDLLGLFGPATRADTSDASVHVIIPFRDIEGGDRLRNLVACLAALHDQNDQPGCTATVTVVEADSQPRWQAVIEPLADRYLFLPAPGEFNKSWTVNVGVVHTPGTPDLVCVLDADVLVDRDFLARNWRRFAGSDHEAHLTYRQMYCLDESSTYLSIDRRCHGGHADVSLEDVRAYVLREPPGACLWTTSAIFHHIGGFDERFVGWGGEDNDVVARLERAGPFARFDDPLLHLHHRRPKMRSGDGRPLNPDVQSTAWARDLGYGRVPSSASAVGDT